MAAAKRSGAKVVLDVTTTHVDHFGEQQDREGARFGVRPTWHPRLRARTREEYRRADRIRVMSHVAARTLIDRGVPAERVIVATPPCVEGLVPQAQFAEPVFRVLFVGLIEPAKGFHYLIDAFRRLPHKDAELELWGGPGARPVTNYLNAQMAADRRIRLRPGGVRATGFAKVYGRASVLVLPSLADGFGYVAGEAMACGVPVIVTTATGAADLVIDGQNGYIVPPADATAIAERLRHLADNPALVRRLGAGAHEAAARHTPESFRESLVPPILNLLNAAGSVAAGGVTRPCVM
jgi:glycosyltransferase involved in cell wall biosynthesis